MAVPPITNHLRPNAPTAQRCADWIRAECLNVLKRPPSTTSRYRIVACGRFELAELVGEVPVAAVGNR